jgi:hypothetical protein
MSKERLLAGKDPYISRPERSSESAAPVRPAVDRQTERTRSLIVEQRTACQCGRSAAPASDCDKLQPSPRQHRANRERIDRGCQTNRTDARHKSAASPVSVSAPAWRAPAETRRRLDDRHPRRADRKAEAAAATRSSARTIIAMTRSSSESQSERLRRKFYVKQCEGVPPRAPPARRVAGVHA